MSMVGNTSNDDIPLFDDDIRQFYFIQFWIFLLLIISCIIASLVTLYLFFHDRTLRQALHNHTIIIILPINVFYQLTDASCFLHYFRYFESFPPSPTFRLIWGYIDWTFFTLQVMLYAWITIERHILIFHAHLVATRNKRLIFHYAPPVAISLYCVVYYTMIFFTPQCQNDFDDLTQPSCYPCAFENNILSMYETVVNDMAPVFTIVLSSIVLLMRSIWQRYHTQRQIHWRQYRKMTVQVLVISSLYFIFLFPWQSIVLLHLCGVPNEVGAVFLSRAMFVTYYTLFLFPIVTLGSLPELREKVRKSLRCRRRQQRSIGPETLGMTRMANNRVDVQ